eukprot:Rhum_TRINITY_DN9623_c0_g1::Rhum_TRINITY_DN9623_c0_g1_i1::g.34452::m.34452
MPCCCCCVGSGSTLPDAGRSARTSSRAAAAVGVPRCCARRRHGCRACGHCRRPSRGAAEGDEGEEEPEQGVAGVHLHLGHRDHRAGQDEGSNHRDRSAAPAQRHAVERARAPDRRDDVARRLPRARHHDGRAARRAYLCGRVGGAAGVGERDRGRVRHAAAAVPVPLLALSRHPDAEERGGAGRLGDPRALHDGLLVDADSVEAAEGRQAEPGDAQQALPGGRGGCGPGAPGHLRHPSCVAHLPADLPDQHAGEDCRDLPAEEGGAEEGRRPEEEEQRHVVEVAQGSQIRIGGRRALTSSSPPAQKPIVLTGSTPASP